jgi:hypothetical protein
MLPEILPPNSNRIPDGTSVAGSLSANNWCCVRPLVAFQDTARDEIVAFPQGGVGRGFFKLGPLRTGELPLKTIKQSVDDVALAIVKRRSGMCLPKLRLA